MRLDVRRVVGSVGGEHDLTVELVGLGLGSRFARRRRHATVSVDRHRQAEAVLVVGVVADEVDAAGCAPRASTDCGISSAPSSRGSGMGRLQRSWCLGKVSWRVLRSDGTLAVFPVLMGIGALVVVGVFGGLIVLAGIDDTGSERGLAPMGGCSWCDVPRRRCRGHVLPGCARASGPRGSMGTTRRSAAPSRRRRGSSRDRRVGDHLDHGVGDPRAIAERAGFIGVIVAALFGAAWTSSRSSPSRWSRSRVSVPSPR